LQAITKAETQQGKNAYLDKKILGKIKDYAAFV